MGTRGYRVKFNKTPGGPPPPTQTGVFSAVGKGTASLSTVLSGGRNPFTWPFSGGSASVLGSAWNRPIGTDATYISPTGVISQFGNIAMNDGTGYSKPVYLASLSDPLRNVTASIDAFTDPDSGTQSPRPYTTQIRIPNSAAAATGTDHHLIIVDSTKTYIYEMYYAVKQGDSSWTCRGWYVNWLRQKGHSVSAWHGANAYGGSCIGGLIRSGELAAGIPHALRLAASQTLLAAGVVWPATSTDATGTESNCKESTLIAIPQNVNLLSLGIVDSRAMKIAEAFQKYGGYFVDGAGVGTSTVVTYLETNAAAERPSAGSAFWTDLQQRIAPQLRLVSNNSSTQFASGGGTAIAAYAPPFEA